MTEFLIDRAERAHATLLLAHGAGAPMDTPFMQHVASGLAAQGVTTVRFEFPYMARRRAADGRGPPDRMPVLESCFRELVSTFKPREPRLFVGGKSMGGRVATHIADDCEVRGVVALGYPFHPPNRPTQLRTEHLQTLRTPCLIVQGTRDTFGMRDEVTAYELPARIRVHWLEDGDHSFVPRKTSGRTLAQNLQEALLEVARFTRET